MDIKLFLVVSVLVLVGFYEASCRRSPPPYMTKVMQAIITRILDISSCLPVILALMADTAQTMSIDTQGEELVIPLPDIEENVSSVLGCTERCQAQEEPCE
jgi:hypothetical protein